MLLPNYVHSFPLIPGGGLFFLPVGIGVALGAFFPRMKMALVWGGMAAGVLCIVLGRRFYEGLPPPGAIQVAFFAAAIAAEAVAFRLVIPRVRALGERPLTICTLLIVGAHFLIMIPAFGLPIAVLAILCLANVGAGFVLRGYQLPRMWFIDGLFKIGVGGLMLAASPVFA